MENKAIECTSCGSELTEADNFCPNCGARRQNEPTRCKFCGTELKETDKFCTNCGKKRNVKSKKPLFRKWWFWIVGLVVIGVITIGGMDAVSEFATKTPSAIDTPMVDKVDETVGLKLLQSIVESTIGDYYDYYEVYVNEEEKIIALKLTNVGLGEAIQTAKATGLDEKYEPWIDVKNAQLELYGAIYEISQTIGIDGIEINMCIIDDQNHDSVVLVISDGVILYDYLAR